MVSLADQEFQHELCEFGLYPHKVADVDDDGKPRRTGVALLSLKHTSMYLSAKTQASLQFLYTGSCLYAIKLCMQKLFIYIYDNLDDIYVIPDE
jgi:hypothetical protein